jgi:cell division protein FtsI (penicillin-binding protein 3)
MAPAPTGRRRPARRRGGLLGSPKPARNGTDGRIRLLRLAFLVFLILVGGKAVALASSSQHLAQYAVQQQTAEITLPAHRGSILDRTGAELAVGKPAQTVVATPYLLQDAKAAADELCDALQINRKRERRAVEKALVWGKKHHSGFAYVERKADPEYATAAVDLGLPGVYSYAEEERTYPLKGVAAQVVGFAGTENTGLAGMELLYDKQLSGKPGSETIVQDPAGHTLRTMRQKLPTSGQDVRLTLDGEIQYTAEKVLEKTLRATAGKWAVSIVMDPRTGEVYAMANVTDKGFHGYGKDPEADKNRAVTDVYEPGSIFKLVTISGALADGTITPTQKFHLPPTLQVADRTINESHPRGYVDYDVRQILQWSSNVGAVTIGGKMGKQGMARWIKAYGFGKPTGVQFPGEVGGLVAPVDQWSDSSIGNIPMGQGIAVTALQMASAFSTVADNGIQVKPRLVKQVGKDIYHTTPADKHRVIPAKVAKEIRSYLTSAVDEGTGTKAQIPGYKVAGKTGTAEIALPNGGGYAKNIYTASFIGMAPADHPRLVVLCAVGWTPEFGGDAAAPAVKQIMQFALQHLEIAP